MIGVEKFEIGSGGSGGLGGQEKHSRDSSSNKQKYKRQRRDSKEEEWRSQHPSGSLGTAHWSGSQGSNTERPWLGASGTLLEGELACKQSFTILHLFLPLSLFILSPQNDHSHLFLMYRIPF